MAHGWPGGSWRLARASRDYIEPGMKIGSIGMGIMGSAIARTCIAAGVPVVGFDSNLARTRPGARTVRGPLIDDAGAIVPPKTAGRRYAFSGR